MQELVKLRQQHQTTDHQLQAFDDHVQGMEQCQQQMMSFLAKAMNSPGFLAQFVQQSNGNSQCITGAIKKRKLPNQGELEVESASPDGQIVKYLPSKTEAAHSLHTQIVKSVTSLSLDALSNSNSIIPLGKFSLPSKILENRRSSSSVSSAIMHSEAPVTSGLAYVPTSSGSAVCSSSAISELQPSPCLVDPGVYGMIPTDPNIGLFTDGNDAKLPGIVDSFWEQFLSACPISRDTEEVESSFA